MCLLGFVTLGAFFRSLWNILRYCCYSISPPLLFSISFTFRFSHFPQVNKHFSHKHDKNLNYILLFAWWLTQFRWWKRLWKETHNQRHLRAREREKKKKNMMMKWAKGRWGERVKAKKRILENVIPANFVLLLLSVSLPLFVAKKVFSDSLLLVLLLLETEVQKKIWKKVPQTFVLMYKYTDPAPMQIERCAC